MADVSDIELIRRIFSEHLRINPPADDVDLIEAGVLDSFMFVELLLQLEQTFGMKIALESLEIDNFKSMRSIAGVVAASNDRNLARIG